MEYWSWVWYLFSVGGRGTRNWAWIPTVPAGVFDCHSSSGGIWFYDDRLQNLHLLDLFRWGDGGMVVFMLTLALFFFLFFLL